MIETPTTSSESASQPTSPEPPDSSSDGPTTSTSSPDESFPIDPPENSGGGGPC